MSSQVNVSRGTVAVGLEEGSSVVVRAAQWAGLDLGRLQRKLLALLAEWLVTEAIPAGGLGPAEADVISSRHLADSLLFAAVWDYPTPPRSILDVGAGVGLPGIPLAIAWPNTQVVLLDRSERRSDLARRAVRLLSLDNVQVATVQLQEWTASSDFVVCRGAGTPDALQSHLTRLVAPHGRAAMGGSHRSRPRAPGYHVWEVPAGIMGHPVWLLSLDRK